MANETRPVIACSLGPRERRARQAAFGDLLRRQPVGVEALAGGVRLRFPATAAVRAAVADLVERERACCPFLDFRITASAGELQLVVTAPPEAASLARALAAVLLPEGARPSRHRRRRRTTGGSC